MLLGPTMNDDSVHLFSYWSIAPMGLWTNIYKNMRGNSETNIAPNVMCYPDQETSTANVVIMFMIQEEEMIK